LAMLSSKAAIHQAAMWAITAGICDWRNGV